VSTTIQEPGREVALDQIRVPENVRALDPAHVDALAGSIALQGMLVPVVVRDDGDGFELVAGFHRIAAAQSLGLAEVPVVVRDAQTEDADRAVENITRKQLNPYEEAKAVKAMLDRGLTEDGAAQAHSLPTARPSADRNRRPVRRARRASQRARRRSGTRTRPRGRVVMRRGRGATAGLGQHGRRLRSRQGRPRCWRQRRSSAPDGVTDRRLLQDVRGNGKGDERPVATDRARPPRSRTRLPTRHEPHDVLVIDARP
jgi:hypothetical protein